MFGKFLVIRLRDGKLMRTSLFPLEIKKGQRLVFLSEDFSLCLPPGILHFHGEDFRVDFVSNDSASDGSTANHLSHFMVTASPQEIEEIIEAVEHELLSASDISEERAEQNRYLAVFKPAMAAYREKKKEEEMEMGVKRMMSLIDKLDYGKLPFSSLFSGLFKL